MQLGPRWSQSLLVERSVYEVGSTCGTCDLLLKFIGWRDDLFDTAETGRGRHQRWPEGVDFAGPLIQQLRSGRYLVGQLSFPIERIEEKNLASSWFNRRHELRRLSEDDEDDEPNDAEVRAAWPGAAHYQGPRGGGETPTYPVVMPLHDLTKLDEARVVAYQQAISDGACPVAVVLGWVDVRDVQARWAERFANFVILNGHHRLEAYARAGVAANIIAIARIADSWGPPDRPDKYLREAFGPLGGR